MEHRSRRAAREGCVELMQAIETPPAILIRWPAAPTVTDLRRFPAAALAVIAIMNEAMARLATMKPGDLSTPRARSRGPRAIRPGSS